MAEYQDREHYIPLRKSDVIELLCKDPQMPSEDRQPFRQFCTIVSAIFHFEYLEKLESLKDLHAPFDPDSQTRPLTPLVEDKKERTRKKLFEEFTTLMERANFKRMSKQDIEDAMSGGASDWGLNMTVDFEIFDQFEIYARGEGIGKRSRRHPILFWRKEEKEVETFSRLVLMLKFKQHKRLPSNVDTESVYMKLFKDIPKLDLEMIIPGARIQMPGLQRGKLGASLLGTIGYLIYQMGAQILAAVKATAVAGATALGYLWAPFVAVAGYGYKQWYSYQVTRQTYSSQLTESLYYQNLDNNGGVLTRLLDEAEEQECREAILAYFSLLWKAPEQGWTNEQLDDFVEMYLEGSANLKVDFEIGDALEKVERLGLVEKSGENYKAVPLSTALERLDYRWDNYFQYNRPAPNVTA